MKPNKVSELSQWVKVVFYAIILALSLSYFFMPSYTQAVWAWLASSLLQETHMRVHLIGGCMNGKVVEAGNWVRELSFLAHEGATPTN